MDRVSSEKRSNNMRRIRSKNTKPEMVVRRLVFNMGYRFRLHDNKLPGKPDMVFASRKKIVFIHGCFWHHHLDPSCKISRLPKSRTDYWIPKIQRNVSRDEEIIESLNMLGWSTLVIWECELGNMDILKLKLSQFLQTDTND